MQPNGNRPVIISFRLEHLLGWTITIALCIVPVIFWLQQNPLSSISGFSATMLAIGKVTGLVGIVMYSLNLIYATRLRILERFFGGLNRVYIAHHMLGGLALVFLSLHPLFLALRFVQTSLKQAALMLLPNGLFPLSALFDTSHQYHGLVLEQWAIFLGILAFWGMIGLLLVTFFIKLPYRIWLYTHKFLGVAFFLGALHVLFITSDTSTNTALKYYILGMAALGIVAFIYRTLFSKMLIKRYQYIVDEVKELPGGVFQLGMHPNGQTMFYQPGQFIFIRFTHSTGDKVSQEWHPFSISSPSNSKNLQITVKALGDYTSRLNIIKPGTTAEIEGAYGRFSFLNFKNRNQIWIAGGIGVTPFLSMGQSLPDDGYHVDLYYSVKTRSELIDFEKLADATFIRHGNFKIYPYIGDEQEGHLSADYIEKTSGGLSGKDIFICGPPPMMQSLRKQLKSKAVPGARIHSEEFGMS
ncbi:ferric reductase-like transmembrane domain-containing protein [Candidatus Saccharibacteria bacterium]|nr:ferric reductase-like transmembrane domain-containing protein [Candidatus Saccharibacteria bacterium]